MKNSDEAVERALAAMRDAEAPEGMEARIVARLALQLRRGKMQGFGGGISLPGLRWPESGGVGL